MRSADGHLELQLPAGWRSPGSTFSRQNYALGPSGEEWATVKSSNKQDYRDLRSYDAGWQRLMHDWLGSAPSTSSERVLVGGHPGLRWEIVGTSPDGVRVGYVMTSVETETRFGEVFAWTTRSHFPERKGALADIANRLREPAASR